MVIAVSIMVTLWSRDHIKKKMMLWLILRSWTYIENPGCVFELIKYVYSYVSFFYDMSCSHVANNCFVFLNYCGSCLCFSGNKPLMF